MDYRDVRLSQPITGYPEIVLRDDERAVVSDWTGRCFAVELTSGKVKSHASFSDMGGLVGNVLSSLCLSPDGKRCAVATKGGWAGVWTFSSGEATRHYPSGRGPVNAVSFSPDGRSIAVGLGFYPLNPRHDVSAAVEIMSADEEVRADRPGIEGLLSRHVTDDSIALPGVCVDWIGWGDGDVSRNERIPSRKERPDGLV